MMNRPVLKAVCALVLACSIPAVAAPKPAPATPKRAPAKPALPSPAMEAMTAAMRELGAATDSLLPAAALDKMATFHFSAATSRMLVKTLGTDNIFSVKRMPAARGTQDYVMTLPALRHSGPDGTVSWAQMHIDMSVQADGKTVLANGAAPRLSIEDKSTVIDLREMTLQASNRREPGSAMAYGDATVGIGTMQMTTRRDGSVVTLEGLSGGVGIKEQGETVSISYAFGVDKVKAQGEQVDDIRLALHADGIDKQALEAFMRASQQMNKQAGTPDTAASLNLMRNLGQAILRKGATVVLDDMHFAYRGNTARMSGQAEFDGITPEDLGTPAVLLKKVKAKFEIKVPLAMVRSFTDAIANKQMAQQAVTDREAVQKAAYDNAIRTVVGMNYANIDGDMLVTTFEIRDGAMLVNGKPLPVNTVPPAPAAAAVDSKAGRLMAARRIADKCVMPDYPQEVIAGDRALSMSVRLTVNADGSVTGATIARSSGMPAYDKAVLGAAAQCLYIPALRDGKPVAVPLVWDIVRDPGTQRP